MGVSVITLRQSLLWGGLHIAVSSSPHSQSLGPDICEWHLTNIEQPVTLKCTLHEFLLSPSCVTAEGHTVASEICKAMATIVFVAYLSNFPLWVSKVSSYCLGNLIMSGAGWDWAVQSFLSSRKTSQEWKALWSVEAAKILLPFRK